jgi:hypothetical protein
MSAAGAGILHCEEMLWAIIKLGHARIGQESDAARQWAGSPGTGAKQAAYGERRA